MELRCSSQFGFYAPVFIAVGFTVSLTVSVNVKSLLAYGLIKCEEKKFKKDLKTINKTLVLQLQSQGYSERDSQVAVLQSRNTTFEAALLIAVTNAEKSFKPVIFDTVQDEIISCKDNA